jgi:hypothetical protein
MIMLLTDGGSDLAEDVFKKYNPKDHQVNYRKHLKAHKASEINTVFPWKKRQTCGL